MKIVTIAIALLAASCASTREGAMRVGNNVASVQAASGAFPGGYILAYALSPIYFGGLAVYRAAGGKEDFPSGF